MEKSSFFNSVNGDRKYNAAEIADYFASFIGNGIFPNPSTNLQVMANNNMTVTVKPGRAWINGYFYSNTDDLILNLSAPDALLERIDRVVIRLDFINREVRVYIKKGTPASSPVVPDIQRDIERYELCIADIYIAKSAANITQANITDTRMNTEVCGWVNSLIQADTTSIFNQYLDWFYSRTNEYETYMADKESQFEQEFSYWFANIKGTLSGDVAGNLQTQIDNLKTPFTWNRLLTGK